MSAPHAELVPDLDWMLQSAQVSDEALTETLIRDYAGRVAQLAASILQNPDQALEVVRQTVTRAVLDRRRCWGKSSARAWIYALALQACRSSGGAKKRRLDDVRQLAAAFRLPPLEAEPHLHAVAGMFNQTQALMLYLTLGHSLSPEETAYLLKTPVEQVQAQLNVIGEILDLHRQHCAECALRPGGLPEVERRLSSAWQAAKSGEGLSAPDLERLQGEMPTRVSGQRRMRQVWSHLPEFAVVGALMAAMFALGLLSNRLWIKPESSSTASLSGPLTATSEPFFHYTVKSGDTLQSIAQEAGTSVNLILLLNLLPPQTELYPGQTLILPANQFRASQVTPAPFTPVPLPPPLSWQSSPFDIVQRADTSREYWRSLWADVQVIQYGPPGHVGPPQSVTRKQVWLLQPDYSRVIYGPANAEPSGTFVISRGYVYGQDLNSKLVYEDLTSNLVIDPDLQTLFVPGEPWQKNGQFRFAGQEPVAGRPTMMLDLQNANGGRSFRYWIDAQNGVILRRREYGGANSSAVLADVTVTDIAFDVDIPLTLFDPQAYPGDQFAMDYTGAPAASALPPPASQPPSPLPTALAGH
jgi:LysM repeat protein